MPPILVIALMESDHNPCGIKITAAMGSLLSRARRLMPWRRIKLVTTFLGLLSNLMVM